MEGGFNRVAELVSDLLFPRFCVVCEREGGLLCASCEDGWAPVSKPVSCCFCGAQGSAVTCGDCAGQTYLDGVTSLAPYANVVLRQLIGQWKYYGDRSVEPVLKRLMARMVNRIEPPLAPWTVCWVPLHVWRERERGFDQGEVVARMVGELWGLPVEGMLERVR